VDWDALAAVASQPQSGPQPPARQAAQDDEVAAVLAYLQVSYAALPGQPRPLNHPRFVGGGEARLHRLLGGPAALLVDYQFTLRPASRMGSSRGQPAGTTSAPTSASAS